MSYPERPFNYLDITPGLLNLLVQTQFQLEEEVIREEVIRVLRAQGYTVIPPLPPGPWKCSWCRSNNAAGTTRCACCTIAREEAL